MLIQGDNQPHREWVRSPSGLLLSEDAARLRYAPPKDVLGGDFFSGCGGAALGFKQAGIHVLFGVEWEGYAALTYLINLGADELRLHIETDKLRRDFEKKIVGKDKRTGLTTISRSGSNRPAHIRGTEHFWIWDIRNLTGAAILGELGMEVGDLDVIHGSPPCQGFSNAGKRSIADPRNNLMLEYARMIAELRPKTFTLEQVPGVLSMTMPDGQPVLDAFIETLEAGGYAKRKTLEGMIKAQGGGSMLLHRGRLEKIDPASTVSADLPQADLFEVAP